MNTRSPIALLLVVFSLQMICAAKDNPPLFVNPAFDPNQVDRISVFVIDLTNKDYKKTAEALGGIQNQALIALGFRGYRGTTAATQTPLTADMLPNPSQQTLDGLGNGTAPWIMIVTLDTLGTRVDPIKGAGKGAVSVYLYDKSQATLFWRDQAEGTLWGGLLGNLIDKGAIQSAVCSHLVSSMINKMPKRVRPKK